MSNLKSKHNTKLNDRYRDFYTYDKITKYSYFIPSSDNGKFGVGTLLTILQIVAMLALLYFISFASKHEYFYLCGFTFMATHGIAFFVILYVVLLVPCYFVTHKYRDSHYGAILNDYFAPTVFVGVIICLILYSILKLLS